ncbi:papain family cysteine protease, partial [Oesophagostomum dentatum]
EFKGVCKPYAFHPCGKHKDQPYYGECPEEADAPRCRRRCQYLYRKKYEEDKIYAVSRYEVEGGESAMQREIMENGPIQGSIMVFSDFRFYKKGIYVHTYGQQEGVHGIKLIGWGVENGTKYWLVSNSWNSDWGEDGFFRILRGADECGIEEWGYAGKMRV